jgi:molybdopterin adenylyltransferase
MPAPSAFVLTVSDRGAAGERLDASGSVLADRLAEIGFVVDRGLVADDAAAISAALLDAAGRHQLVLTTGGTGLGPRDVTPEATAAVLERHAPGIAEAIRADGRMRTPYAALSRAVAGLRGRCLIVNLPGSPRGAAESLAVLEPLLDHALATLAGPFEHGDPSATLHRQSGPGNASGLGG